MNCTMQSISINGPKKNGEKRVRFESGNGKIMKMVEMNF